MIIREETESDYREVENITREAFYNVYCPGCSEHYILNQFRDDASFIKELSLLIQDEQTKEILAHIMYCKTIVISLNGDKKEVIMFGPVSVLPKYQNNGLGSKLIQYSLEKAKELGYKAVVITGDFNYYKRFAFTKASNYNLYFDKDNKKQSFDFFMAKELVIDYLKMEESYIVIPTKYEVNISDVEDFDSNFYKKEKLKLSTQIF
ncbi:MAG: GNAT family N-acetyltransferase [Pleomorphochaeta sp.]